MTQKDIFQYINGERTVVYLKQDKNEPVTDNYFFGLRLMNNVQTKAAGDGEGTVHGMCHMCGNTTDVYPKYGYICAECLGDTEFMDEIVVTPGNDGWGGSNYCGLCGGNCDCLKNGSLICFCSPGDNPGTGCSYCGRSGCNGECRNSGEGNGNGNNGTGSLNINWTSDQSFNSLFQSVLNVNNSKLIIMQR